MSVKRESRSLQQLANHEVVTIAVYLLGGESTRVDTEDVAVEANRVAPGRFTWRKYPEQINIENVRTFLSDAKKIKNGAYLSGSGKDGWMLTAEGKVFAEAHLVALDRKGSKRRRLSPPEKRWVARESTRLLESSAAAKVRDGRAHEITQREAEQFFRLDDYVVGSTRQQKIDRVINLLGDDPELGPIIIAISKQLKEDQQ